MIGPPSGGSSPSSAFSVLRAAAASVERSTHDVLLQVLDIDAERIDEPPSFGLEVDTDFILGMGKTSERVTMLLDIRKVLTGAEVAALGAM